MVSTCGENYTYNMILKISLMFRPLKHSFQNHVYLCIYTVIYCSISLYIYLYAFMYECFQVIHYQREANTYIRYEYIFLYVIYI